MTNGSILDYIKSEERDLTINGKCSGCGECCTEWLPMTESELNRIKKYVASHKIKPYKRIIPTAKKTYDMTCPFYNPDQKICMVYEVRPAICRQYICRKDKTRFKPLGKNYVDFHLREIFCGERFANYRKG